ncbi:hydantoinase/oxoprolinase family protein [Planctellipticum variicoloris]|uniref:hydantoinase/oxoprolinase family protein n=1 Tax=Planctellipticum variicoloris TaxID=3064265 RepID=UPI0030134CC9|nr:hypothetical protein SH412_004967 [Planctomycetaceae bacterium SH412]
MQTFGLDIGGANLKAATADGQAVTLAFPLWREPQRLPAALRELLSTLPAPDRLAVATTGELADCYATKAEGVREILAAVIAVAGECPIDVWQTSGEFVTPDEALDEPLLTAAANWHALATWLGRLQPQGNALVLDIGTTTTDIIPLEDSLPVPAGRTDVGRLLSRELVYTGVRRTPLCAVAGEIPFRGELCPLGAELFATTVDVYLLTGELPEDPLDTNTANGKPATRAAAHDRLARQLCCDRTEIELAEAAALARAFRDCQLAQIAQAVEQVLARQSGPCDQLIASGSGSFLIPAVRERIPALANAKFQSLDKLCSPALTEAACAFALARLAEERWLTELAKG